MVPPLEGLEPTVVSPAAIWIREIELPRKFFNPIAINLRLGPRKPPSIAKPSQFARLFAKDVVIRVSVQ